VTQRTLAGLLAVLMFGALVALTVFKPLPYVSFQPGGSINVLGASDGKEIVQVTGHKAYRDDGQLRMTTVLMSTPDARLDLFSLVADWLNPEDDLYPFTSIYQTGETPEQNRQEGQTEMVDSQQAATAVAEEELGYDVVHVDVDSVTAGAPADGKLEKGDRLLRIGGQVVSTPTQVQDAITQAPRGQPLTFDVRRGGKHGKVVTTRITPTEKDGNQIVGITIGVAFTFPFDVKVRINPNIGGPSAGLMFSLSIYDTLTPGALTGGKSIAGTGTMDVDGKVGPIGGIMQKIAGARKDGAQLFLVPPDNCGEALQARNGDMRLVKAVTMHAAVQAIQAWVKNPEAELPTCPATSNEKG
jgi:PDZ domain-containing protein